MYFSPNPKESLNDYFNFKNELDRLKKYLINNIDKLIVVKGLRRMGKTSFINVGLSIMKLKYIKIDSRVLAAPTRVEFEKRLLNEFKKAEWLPQKILKSLKSLEFGGFKVSIYQIDDLWDFLKKNKVILTIDEAQLLAGSGVENLIASIYDDTKCKLLITGSEVGVLEKFLGEKDAHSPLFGRAYRIIDMPKLDSKKTQNFLTEGFSQINQKITNEQLEKATSILNGIIGWLTYLGYSSVDNKFDKALEITLNKGIELVKAEFDNFLSSRLKAKNRYKFIMEAVAKSFNSWSQIKDYLEFKIGYKVTDSRFNNYLVNLTNYSFLSKDNRSYLITDPIVTKTFRNSLRI
ncbi:ATP-binding protein [bacterium]|nr:ATP-binding protein [bacterium]